MTLWCLYPLLESQKILLMHLNGVEEIKLKWPPFLDLKITIHFKKNNKNGINFWIDSKAYNHVELCHLYILLTIVDMIIGKFVYKFN